MKRICVFCGANLGQPLAFAAAATEVGRLLGARGLGLVYGGGAVGLMGVVANSALAAGAEVVGVIPEALATKEVAHPGLTRLEIVPSMHARKARMTQLADAFLALPGGFGTLDELFEALTWAQLGLHDKPIFVLDVEGYFAPLLRFIEGSVASGLVRPEHGALVHAGSDPGAVLDDLVACLFGDGPRPARLPKWITPAQS